MSLVRVFYALLFKQGWCFYLLVGVGVSLRINGQAVPSTYNALREQNPLPDRIFTAHPVLLLPQNARSTAVGFVRTAPSASTSMVLQNVSSLVFTDATPWGVELNYLPFNTAMHVDGTYLLTAGGYYKLGAQDILSSTLRFLNFGQLELINLDYEYFGKARPYTLVTDMSYTRRLYDKFSVGLTGRFIHGRVIGSSSGASAESVDVIVSKAFALDLSAAYRTPSVMRSEKRSVKRTSYVGVGLCVSNLGIAFSNRYDYGFVPYLPANVSLGLSYAIDISPEHSFMVAADVNKLLVPVSRYAPQANADRNIIASWGRSFVDATDGFSGELAELYYSVGIESLLYKQLALRAGYAYQSPVNGGHQAVTVGLGFVFWHDFEASLAYAHYLHEPMFARPFRHILFVGLAYRTFQRGYQDVPPRSRRLPVPRYY